MELRKGFAGQTAEESSTMTLRPSDAATLCSFASVAVTSPASRRAMAALLVLMRAGELTLAESGEPRGRPGPSRRRQGRGPLPRGCSGRRLALRRSWWPDGLC